MGTLDGYIVIELAGLGPAPMAGMILADMGARVIRIERPGASSAARSVDVSLRGKQSVVLDLKQKADRAALQALIDGAHVLIDPYRPGVCERLGFGPEVCLDRNPRLIYARMTGWGQDGPLAHAAGHDINYIAITGALHAIGRHGQKPAIPLNLIGDMGGGGMLLVNGILAALLETARSGCGQVVDAAMVDGTAQLMWMFHGFMAAGKYDATRREANLLDGGAPFYDVYECADGRYVAIGAIESTFYELLLRSTGVDPAEFVDRSPEQWPRQKERLAQAFKTRTRRHWCEVLEGTDACFAPVLSLEEAPHHPANHARGNYIEVDGHTQPAPAPRFSRTPSRVLHGARALGQDTDEVLQAFGVRVAAQDRP